MTIQFGNTGGRYANWPRFCIQHLERKYTPLDRKYTPLDRKYMPLDRKYMPLDRKYMPLYSKRTLSNGRSNLAEEIQFL